MHLRMFKGDGILEQIKRIDIPYNLKQLYRFVGLKNLMPGKCYELINEIVSKNLLEKNEYIAYGYVSDDTDFIIRHCWIIDNNSYVIDPINAEEEKYNEYGNYLRYYPIKLMTKDEYIKYIDNDKSGLGLKVTFFENDKKMITEFTNHIDSYFNELKINDVDYFSYIRDCLLDCGYLEKVNELDLKFEVSVNGIVFF